MAEEREREVAEIDPVEKALEQAARKRGLRDLQQELVPLCCLVDTVGQDLGQLRRCGDCNNFMCKDHMGFIHGSFICTRCAQIRLLFPDMAGAPDANTSRQELPIRT